MSEIAELSAKIAAEEDKLAALESDVRHLQEELLRFKQAYEQVMQPHLQQIALVKSAIAEIEHQHHLRTQKTTLNASQFAWTPPPDHDPVGKAYRRVWEPLAAKTQPLPPPPEDERPDLKKLYRELARRYHPDHATNEDERLFRTQMMAEINAAYAERDFDALRALNGSAAPQESMQVLLVRQLQERYNKLRKRVFELKQQRQNLLDSDLMQLKAEADIAHEQGRDLLQDLASDAEREYRALLRRLYELRQQTTQH